MDNLNYEVCYITIALERYEKLLRDSNELEMLRECQRKNKWGVPSSIEEMILGKRGSEVTEDA